MRPFTYISFATENLTSVYLPFNIAVIKDLKINIRRKYNRILSRKRKKRAEKVNIAREDTILMVTLSFENINKINNEDQRIR